MALQPLWLVDLRFFVSYLISGGLLSEILKYDLYFFLFTFLEGCFRTKNSPQSVMPIFDCPLCPPICESFPFLGCASCNFPRRCGRLPFKTVLVHRVTNTEHGAPLLTTCLPFATRTPQVGRKIFPFVLALTLFGFLGFGHDWTFSHFF